MGKESAFKKFGEAAHVAWDWASTQTPTPGIRTRKPDKPAKPTTAYGNKTPKRKTYRKPGIGA
jgi:hypothetical protein